MLTVLCRLGRNLTLLIGLLLSTQAQAENQQMKKLMGEITQMYMSSMVLIFKQQPLINGVTGDKSILFGDKLINGIKATYQQKYGQAFPQLDHATKRLLVQAMVEVMEDNRALIYDDELPFKGIIPAVFAFQLSAKLSIKGVGLKIKFTRTKDSIRNALNYPDDWESKVMAQIIAEPKVHYDENALLNGKPAYRQFTPLPMAGYCLQCHGKPSQNPLNAGKPTSEWTNIDMTGFEMENWLITDFGGGVSLSVEKANIDD